jgi:hypothetical protein
MQYM